MYFKQVDMTGFKSFADKTTVKLEPGITAVVGPNGCGKSNIMDALRWTLGEQSAKALRGTHMQDVIFNGSEHRPPTGMAEVTLTFDNADNKLPVDFAEVTVTRRVYRSGESEYLMNGAACRLRDIHELFMDTGIGTNAYSLIGQGKIGMVLSSKPDDRRYLFEEAAGIIKYKSRKRVAMRKLDSAEQNLLRLQDVITEVQRQMRSLKRQVNAAIRHRELSETLRELEIRNAWLHYNALSMEITDLKDRFEAAREQYETGSTELGKHDARLEALNLKRIELERVLMARRDGEHQIDTEMEKIESQIALIKRDIGFSQEQAARAQEEAEEFTKRAESLKSDSGETDEKSIALAKEHGDTQKLLDEKQETHKAQQESVTQMDAQVEQLRKDAMDTLNTRNKTQTELETITVSVSNIDDQLKGIYDRQDSQNSRHEELAAQVQQAQAEHGEAQKNLTETVEKRQAAQTERQEMRDKMDALNKEWQELREQKSSQEARLHSLTELRDSYEGFATGVRAVMMAKQKNVAEAQGIIGPVGDLISTEKEFERGIEAALGGNINNVVVETADDAKASINFLKQHRAGRVTFLPLDTIRARAQDDSDALRGLPGVIGKAINYVQCEAHVLPALEYLLYNTVMVETIDDAIRIARSERRFPRLVTLDGEVVSSAGAVTGGRTQHESRGLLGRSAEIEELETKVAEAAKRINTMGAEGQQIADTIQQIVANLKEYEKLEDEHRQTVSTVGVHLAKATTELENLTQSGQQLGQQRDSLVQQRETLEARRGEAQAKVESMDTDDEALQEKIATAQEEASKARQTLSALGDELADLRVRMAELSQSMEEANRTKHREQQEREQALLEVKRREEQIATLKGREKEHEERIADHIERAKALSETKEEAHGKVLESQQEQQKVIEESEHLNKSVKSLRESVQQHQKEVHSLELSLTQKEDRVEFFQDRILTEYNLGLASLSEKEVGTDEYDEEEREKLIQENRKAIQRLGTVNLMAIEEYESLEKRDEFLRAQDEDLQRARQSLLEVVEKIDSTILEMFMDTFTSVAENFKNNFRRLFNGGHARIYLLNEEDPLESGIEIEARPPGKKPQVISLLSGGEQAMTAIALLFSIFHAKPSPFCVLDEVDAPLDDANIGRFLSIVDDFVDRSQFIIITHSKQTMAHANAIFGVTQQERGVSQMVSVKFEDVADTDAA